MWFIVAVQGCLPYIELVKDEEDAVCIFDTRREAEAYAKENCAWDYKVIQW